MTSSQTSAASEASPDTAIDRHATESGFAALGLTGAILKAVADTGYTKPTPIQAQAIPSLLKGRDLLGLAETGTGKTAAFALPLIQRLVAENLDRTPRKCRALILAPTRELAVQIAESLEVYGKHTTLTHTLIYGGVGANPQMRAMQKGVDIIVATPGRLLDLIASRHIHLDEVSHFVLDEADRMLDMGFIHDVRRVVKLLPKSRQSLLFSATMPDDIARLAAEMLNKPERIEVARAGKTVDRIVQSVHYVGAKEKRAALAALLQNPELKRVIVFTRTKRGANRVADTLDVAGISSVAIHGNKSQNARQAALDSFRKGEARVLVATDIAARGIDIDEITHVINYELPNIPESYVHRIGRTARAGAEGIAIALCAADERPYLRDIERLTKTPLTDAGAVPGIEKFMSLPEPKKRRDDEDETPHFARGKARIDSGRGNNRVREDKPADTRGGGPRGDDKRGGGARFGRGDDRGTRGPRKPFDGERRGPAASGERREWKPREDRAPAAGGERREWKPREDRAPAASGERREWKPRENRGPSAGGERREWKPREDRPRSDAPAAVNSASGDAAVEKPKFNPMDVNARRPRDDMRREDRPRFDDRRSGPPRSDRGPAAGGERRDWKPREDRGERGSQGARGGDDRRPFKPREDRGPRSDGPRSSGPRPGGDRPGGRPFESRGPRPGGARPAGPRSDGPRSDGPRPGGPRPGGPRPDGDRPWKPREDRAPRPEGERREWKPRGDRPSGDRPSGDRPQRDGASKPWERRDGGSRPPQRRDGPPGADGSQPRKRAKPDES